MKPKSVFANVSITGVGAKLLPTFSPDDQSDCLLSFFHFFKIFLSLCLHFLAKSQVSTIMTI